MINPIYDQEKEIQSAIELAKEGKRKEAITILRKLLQQNPRNPRAWYLLSQLVDDPKRAQQCLEKVLEIDPDNTQAIERLNKLKQPTIMPELTQEKPLYSANVKNKPKTTIWGIIAILSIISIICVCIGLYSKGTSHLSDIVNINFNDPAPNFYTIRNNMNELTEVQWEVYKNTYVINKTAINWSGWVEEVQQGSGDNYKVLIDMDSPDEFLSVQDIYFDLPASQAGYLQKDQKITFSGRISRVTNFLGSCQINLEDVDMKP
jgi:tetratricopeptide (TPR) repeat protein